MMRSRILLLGAPSLAGLVLTAAPALAWPLGGPEYNPLPASAYGYNLFDPHPGYYGGGYYREYYNYGRGYGVANFPPPLPAYHPYEGALFHRHHEEPAPVFVPGPVIAPDAAADTAAHLVVQVPDGAEVWVDGAATRQTGTSRSFVSPPLTPGRDLSYEVRARWAVAGKTIEQTQTVPVHAGEQLQVRFPVAERLPAPKAATVNALGAGLQTPPGSGSKASGY
jgi:uncharacterized protein (TIGR03000 family)